jgi:hypothetical protein
MESDVNVCHSKREIQQNTARCVVVSQKNSADTSGYKIVPLTNLP